METRLNKVFSGKIFDEDIRNDRNYQKKWNSRAYTAYVLGMLGNDQVPETSKFVTDGFNDNGIDAIYDDRENKKIYFVQTKYSENGSIEVGDLHKFLDGVTQLMNLNFANCNEKIRNQSKIIENALLDSLDYSVELLIALGSDQPLSGHAERVLLDYIKSVSNNDGVVSYRVVHFKNVYDHMADSSTLKNISVKNFILENYGAIKKEDKATIYYGVTPAENIAKLRDDFGNQIFQKNIRYFKKNTDVNNGIIKVLNEEPENFYLYNNGIKIIAKRVDKALIGSSTRDYAILSLEGASIINGAQTTGCLHEIYKKDPKKLQDVKVQVQLISLSNLEDYMTDKITKLSNTQNKIENKDFAVQDPIQEQLKRDLAIDNIDYIYKQGEDDTSSTTKNSCNIDEATVALGCSLEDVSVTTTLKRAYGSIFDDLGKAPYKLIFNKSVSPYRLWNSVRVYRVMQHIEEDYRKNPNNVDKRLISVHGNRMILHLILNKLIGEYKNFDSEYLDNIDKEELEQIYGEFVLALFNKKNEIYPDAYPAYLFKNSTKCKELEKQILGSNV